MEFRILGPLEAIDDGRPVSLGGARQRALLAVLLLHRNEVVPVDRLIDDLWGERSPDTAANVVQVYVSRLRKVLQPNGRPENGDGDVLLTRSSGYLLRVGEGALDLDRFEQLADEGRRALASGDADQASALLNQALALWRGPPLSDFGFEEFARTEIGRLEELRLAALADRIESDLALGRHAVLVGELEALVAEYPLRERFRVQLMLALYRSGRQAEALEVYREARRTLVEELGIEPGSELKDLEQAILRQEAALSVVAASPDARIEVPAASELADVAVSTQDPRAVRRRVPWQAAAIAAIAVLGVVLGLAFALRGDEPAAKLLEPNSVGFIDARSGRVTGAFQVGRQPLALAVGFRSLWVACHRDRTVMRLDRATGRPLATIPVGGHPTAVTAFRGKLWVWTMEHWLVPVDPKYNNAGRPIRLTLPGPGTLTRAGFQEPESSRGAQIAAAGGFLWMAVPATTIVQLDPKRPENLRLIQPDDGAQGPLAARDGEVWVGGFSEVFPITARTGTPGAGAAVRGRVRDLAFAPDGLWVVVGQPAPGLQTTESALRHVDVAARIVDDSMDVGAPVAVAAAAGSIWVVSRSDRAVLRVAPEEAQVADSIPLGSVPTDLVADGDGVWVAVE